MKSETSRGQRRCCRCYDSSRVLAHVAASGPARYTFTIISYNNRFSLNIINAYAVL